jgi:outer membrane immunogenic protein
MTGRLHGRFCVAGLVAIAWSVGAASAADLPAQFYTKAPPPVVYVWTGFYAGLNVGGSWGDQRSSLRSTATGAALLTNSLDLDGVIGGGQIGYNWQFNRWLLGLEADIQGSGQRADGAFATPAALVCGLACVLVPGDSIAYQDKLDWFGTVRGRVGWVMDRWVPYVTGGLAYGQGTVGGTATVGGVATAFNTSKDYVGWTVGGGAEWAFADRWSAKVEYLYIDFGRGPTIPLSPALNITTGHMTDNVGRVGVNFHF